MLKAFQAFVISFILLTNYKPIMAASLALSEPAEDYDSVVSFIKYIPGTTSSFKGKVESYLTILDDTPTGNSLLKAIRTTIEDNVLTIMEVKGGGVCFNPHYSASSGTRILAIEINLEKIETSIVGCIGFPRTELITFDDAKVILFPIGNCPNPPAAVLGHELIHALHYLQDPKNYETNNKKYDAGKWPRLNRTTHHFKADNSLDNNLWGGKLEEQYTVIGFPDDAKFTENNIRRDLGLLPRYAYQPTSSTAHNYFYEDAETVGSIFSIVWGADWESELARLYENSAEVYTFDTEGAKLSRFNPYKLVEHDETVVSKSASSEGGRKLPPPTLLKRFGANPFAGAGGGGAGGGRS